MKKEKKKKTKYKDLSKKEIDFILHLFNVEVQSCMEDLEKVVLPRLKDSVGYDSMIKHFIDEILTNYNMLIDALDSAYWDYVLREEKKEKK